MMREANPIASLVKPFDEESLMHAIRMALRHFGTIKKTERSAQFIGGNLMDILRTPDERFSNLPDYPFEPHYIEAGSLEDPLRGRGAAERGASADAPWRAVMVLPIPKNDSHFCFRRFARYRAGPSRLRTLGQTR